ncbi:MAG: DUF4406 domain-containing protein [Actinobacteria bacterium]|nr:DUF4406 domain-containing protein [Actinomycetota bacterium]
MKRVFIAGKYSDDNIIDVLNNIRTGIRAAVELMLLGYAPFCPFLDYQFQFMLRENENLKVEDYYNYSLTWLEISDIVYILPNSENSTGTQKEIKRAKELNIPIIYRLDEL